MIIQEFLEDLQISLEGVSRVWALRSPGRNARPVVKEKNHWQNPQFFSQMSCSASGRQLIFVTMLVAVYQASFKPVAGSQVAIRPAIVDGRDRRAQA